MFFVSNNETVQKAVFGQVKLTRQNAEGTLGVPLRSVVRVIRGLLGLHGCGVSRAVTLYRARPGPRFWGHFARQTPLYLI